MIDYKIRVNNEAERKKAQELFLEYDATGNMCLDKSIRYVCTFNGVLNQYDFLPSVEFKQITIQELRDLVVLKRNDVGDATHEDYSGLRYLLLTNTRHVWGGDMWLISSSDFSKLKPIEKTMKEFLVKDNITSKYCFIKSEGLDADGSDVIELPKGTELVVQRKDGAKEYFKDGCGCKYWSDKLWHRVSIPFAHIEESNLIWLKDGCQAYWDPKYSSKLPSLFNYVKKKEMKEFLVNHNDKWTLQLLDSDTEENSYRVAVPSEAECLTECMDGGEIFKLWWKGELKICIGCDIDWFNIERDIEDYLSDHPNAKILWRRCAQPEELPFIDDEQSLNDQYAEIEKARQATKETEYLMQGKNGEKLMESLAQFHNTDRGADFDNFELLEDNVNHPSHYSSGEIECIDAIQSSMTHEAFCGYLKGNVQKYMWRYENKGGTESLKKAQWYLNKLIEVRDDTSSED